MLGQKSSEPFPFTFAGDTEPKTIVNLKYPGQAREALYWENLGELSPDMPMGRKLSPEARAVKKTARALEFLTDSIVSLENLKKAGDKFAAAKGIREFVEGLLWQRVQLLCSAVIYGVSTTEEAADALSKSIEETETKNE